MKHFCNSRCINYYHLHLSFTPTSVLFFARSRTNLSIQRLNCNWKVSAGDHLSFTTRHTAEVLYSSRYDRVLHKDPSPCRRRQCLVAVRSFVLLLPFHSFTIHITIITIMLFTWATATVIYLGTSFIVMGRVTRCDIIIGLLLWSGTWNAPMDKLNTWSAELSACSVHIPFAYVRCFGGSAINNTQRRSSISIQQNILMLF